MIDYLSEIPLTGRMLAPQRARNDAGSSDTPQLGFIAGPENRLVASAVIRCMHSVAGVGDAADQRLPKLLSLFGPSGTGKTHLAQGLVGYWNDARGAQTALYLTASDFYRQLLDAIKRDTAGEFRRALRAYELLAIDDLHQLPRHEYVSQELRYTLDAYDESGSKMIVTSPRPADTLANLSPDVRSRLAAGLALQLAPPGTAARIKIIRQASEALGQPFSEQTAGQFAASVPGTANDLFGALFELCAAMANANGEADHAERLVATRAARRPTLHKIVAIVARYYRLPQAQLKSKSRRQSTVLARAMAIYLAREVAAATYEQIGHALGGRDHTTIIHNYRKIDRERSCNPMLQETIDELRHTIMSPYARVNKMSSAC